MIMWYMWCVLKAFWAAMVLNLLVRIGKTNWQTWKQMSFSRPYVTRKPTQAKDVWGKLTSFADLLPWGTWKMARIITGHSRQAEIQLATDLLSWYSIVLGLTYFKNSFRKGLNKNHGGEPAGKRSKSRPQDEGEGSETKHRGKNWSSRWNRK